MAERTGLEPATPGVTGRYSNQLNYRSALCATLISRLFKAAYTCWVRRLAFLAQPSGDDCLVTTRAHYKAGFRSVNVFSQLSSQSSCAHASRPGNSPHMASIIASLPWAVLRYSMGVIPDHRLNAR